MLDTLEDQEVNITELVTLIRKYGDVLEWGASFYAIQKLKSNKFHETKTPAEGLQEGLACLVDFMREIDKEVLEREIEN